VASSTVTVMLCLGASPATDMAAACSAIGDIRQPNTNAVQANRDMSPGSTAQALPASLDDDAGTGRFDALNHVRSCRSLLCLTSAGATRRAAAQVKTRMLLLAGG
jgi:hypothetical protein